MTTSQKLETAEQLRIEIEEILTKNLPGLAYHRVWLGKNCLGSGYYIGIQIAASDYNINNISNQKCQIVSLNLDIDTMELSIRNFGGCGGGSISLQPDMNKIGEKHLYCVSHKIGFRKPKCEIKNVKSAIEKFANNWLIALDENFDRLMYKDLVDYKALLK